MIIFQSKFFWQDRQLDRCGDIDELWIPFQFKVIINSVPRVRRGADESIAPGYFNIVELIKDHFVGKVESACCEVLLHLFIKRQDVITVFVNKRSLERRRRKNYFVFKWNCDGVKLVP